MELRIDRQALVPVVQQIVDALAGWIRSDAVEPGTRLPSIRQLARENLLSQSCVNEAYERMVAQGVLALRHGSVFFVATPRSAVTPAAFAGAAAPGEVETTPAASAPVLSGVLPLGRGGMPESWRESDDLSYAIRHISRTDMAGLFNYSTSFGLLELRQQIQRRLKQINVTVQEHQVLTTAGATHGLDLIIRTLLKPGDCVVVESPGYGNVFEQLRLWGVQMLEVPRTPKGPDVEALQALLGAHQPRALFINSLLHNPTGSNLTAAVAQRIFALAERYQLTIVEDDVYADFQGSASPRLAALDTQGRVIYVGSFSKNLSSSLRVGYVVASAEMSARLAEVKMITSLGVSGFCEAVVAHLLVNGTYRKLVQRQRQRLKCEMCAALQSLEDAEWEVFGRPVGGLYIWARPRVGSPEHVRVQAQRLGISLLGSAAFSPCGRPGNWLRINVAYANDPRALAFFQACGAPDRLQAF
ncbi:DNA-binding transcriptional regulator, MocR family, contains an aminotransferase domain [Pseudomonas sp. ok272]|uniref:aminotransferase-like domain-containing protein n=1 Tax=unclassified Pseudomonas TaxID=196821 RepID=UPI0008D70491|nr:MULTISPECIES: PLP-dependent aminotransferase family protein [unclassified Pseudomonas]SEM70971.1 DNA-binding transcriptional regulator, MocR family, contains an aminotransferase domain [Pseudomonas sp. ok272]SFM59578.1 DNA-binding transcriptional regulator, MocR family, contains an aminotransferase domain [Pseudomonas sp. ok602]